MTQDLKTANNAKTILELFTLIMATNAFKNVLIISTAILSTIRANLVTKGAQYVQLLQTDRALSVGTFQEQGNLITLSLALLFVPNSVKMGNLKYSEQTSAGGAMKIATHAI